METKNIMKKFCGEFKKFILRGNVLDMAVGVIVGGAFTAIVNALSNNILKPIINWLLLLAFGQNSLSAVYTYLNKVEVGGVVDLAQSIYIDWGSFISAVINFLLIALVLFLIVKIINAVHAHADAISERVKKSVPTKQEIKEMKAKGLNYRDDDVLDAYRKEKEEEEKAQKEAEEQKAAEAAAIEREKNPTSEDLLKKIIVILENDKR